MRTTSKSFDSGPWRVVGFYDRRVTVEKMSQNKWFRRAAGAALACASIVSIAPLSGPAAPVVSAVSADPGGEFHALTPTRILDTRPESSINDVQPTRSEAAVDNAVVPLPVNSTLTRSERVAADRSKCHSCDRCQLHCHATRQRGWIAVYPRGL